MRMVCARIIAIFVLLIVIYFVQGCSQLDGIVNRLGGTVNIELDKGDQEDEIQNEDEEQEERS